MPSIDLSDYAVFRIEAISFFVVVLLIAAAVVRWLWNSLAAEFAAAATAHYRRALAAVVLGHALAVVLTMIAGSRELLTPGAWQK